MLDIDTVLFGCGQIGERMLSAIGLSDVSFFVDNYSSKPDILGVPIVGFDEFKNKDKDCLIIISVRKEFAEQIVAQLREFNFENYIYHEDFVTLLSDRIYGAPYSCSELTSFLGVKKARQIIDTVIKKNNLWYDPKSVVEFYLVDAFEISHYFPIYEELRKRNIPCRIVAEPTFINQVGSYFDYERAVDCMSRLNIEFSTMANPKCKIAFTTQYGDCLTKYQNIKCQMAYGVAIMKKTAFQLKRDTSICFDYVFVNGEFCKNIIGQYIGECNVVDMSYPRYKNYFLSPPNPEILMKDLNISKPVLVYLPTWDEYSSIQKYSKIIAKYASNFSIVVKPHHCTAHLEGKRGDFICLKENFDLLVDSNYGLGELASIADVAIVDAKSAVGLEIMFLNPNLKIIAICDNVKTNGFYFELSSFMYTVYSPEELQSTILMLNSYKNGDFNKSREKVIKELYSYDIEQGIERAVDKITDIIKENDTNDFDV